MQFYILYSWRHNKVLPEEQNIIDKKTNCRRRDSARAQLFGKHVTVRAQSSLVNTKWAWGPYLRWSRYPDENWDTLTATGLHGRYPEAVFRDRVRKLGMSFVWPTQPFSWPPCVFVFYYRLIIKLFPCYGLICTHFTFILPTLHISPFNAFGPWQWIGK